MKFGAQQFDASEHGELPMTSMIDVVFLLLIFFMVTASFAEPEDRLPAAIVPENRTAAPQTLEPQIVRVEPGPDGSHRFAIGAIVVTSRDQLAAALRRLPKEPGVIIVVDDRVPIHAAAAALQAAEDAGFEKRTYAAAGGSL